MIVGKGMHCNFFEWDKHPKKLSRVQLGDENMKTLLKLDFTYICLMTIACCSFAGCQQPAGSDKDEPHNPRVISIDPADQSESVAPDSKVTIVFDSEMDGDTVTVDSVKLYHQSGTEVAGDVTLDVDTTYFTPQNYLEKNTDYTVEVSSSIKDISGNPLDNDVTSGFRVVFEGQPFVIQAVRNIYREFHLATNMEATQDVTYEVITSPELGTVVITGSEVSYKSNTADATTDSFSYRADNGVDVTEAVTVDLTINTPMFSDTGQTGDYTMEHGEDSDYHINSPSFAYNDASNDTVLDEMTELVWQTTHNGLVGSVEDASTDCHELDLGGYTDWRLPTIKELMFVTIWDDGDSQLDSLFTEDTNASYWAKESYPKQGSSNYFYFSATKQVHNGSTGSATSWCVRGKVAKSAFVDNGDKTVRDESTGLTWQQETVVEKEWEDAIAYCDSLVLANKNDWRLPNIKELLSLFDYSREDPAINTDVFPSTSQDYYWASTLKDNGTLSNVVSFNNGESVFASLGIDFPVRCVRGQ